MNNDFKAHLNGIKAMMEWHADDIGTDRFNCDEWEVESAMAGFFASDDNEYELTDEQDAATAYLAVMPSELTDQLSMNCTHKLATAYQAGVDNKLAELAADAPAGVEMTDAGDIAAFITGGKATFTLVSTATGNRFTFKVSEARDEEGLFFVSVLNGPDNWNNYAYLGLLRGGVFRKTAKSRISENAQSFKVIDWFFRNYYPAHVLPAGVEFWHEGKCGACGRKLTVPASIEQGLGPVCANQLGRQEEG